MFSPDDFLLPIGYSLCDVLIFVFCLLIFTLFIGLSLGILSMSLDLEFDTDWILINWTLYLLMMIAIDKFPADE